MDHALGESSARAHVALEPARTAATFEVADGGRVRRDKVGLWSVESLDAQSGVGAASFLQRLPERDCRIWLARAAHDCLRSSGGSDFVLHFSPGICGVV